MGYRARGCVRKRGTTIHAGARKATRVPMVGTRAASGAAAPFTLGPRPGHDYAAAATAAGTSGITVSAKRSISSSCGDDCSSSRSTPACW